MKDRMSAEVALDNPSLSEDGILLVLPVPFKQLADGRLLCEEQATNGIDQWAGQFSHVTVVAPVKLVPVIATLVPPPVGPPGGATPLTVGAAGSPTTKEVGLPVPMTEGSLVSAVPWFVPLPFKS